MTYVIHADTRIRTMKIGIPIPSLLLLITALIFPCDMANSEPSQEHPLGNGIVTLYRPDKDERATFAYRDKNGAYDRDALVEIAHFFRCRLTDEEHEISPKLIELLDAMEDHFDAPEIQLISGYRSPLRNSIMSARSRRVAKKSLHTEGMAADIKIAGISNRRIRSFAYRLGRGGVGYYGQKSFVHVDTGPVRAWGWMPPALAGRRLAGTQK